MSPNPLHDSLLAALNLGVTIAAISRQSGCPEASISQFKIKGALGQQYRELLSVWLIDKKFLSEQDARNASLCPNQPENEIDVFKNAFLNALADGHTITGIASRTRVPRRSLSQFKAIGALGNAKGYRDKLRAWLEEKGHLAPRPKKGVFRGPRHVREDPSPVARRTVAPASNMGDLTVEDIIRTSKEARQKGKPRIAERLTALAEEFIDAQDRMHMVSRTYQRLASAIKDDEPDCGDTDT